MHPTAPHRAPPHPITPRLDPAGQQSPVLGEHSTLLLPGSIPGESAHLWAQRERLWFTDAATTANQELKTPLEKWELQNISLVPPQKSKNESEKGKVREKAEL